MEDYSVAVQSVLSRDPEERRRLAADPAVKRVLEDPRATCLRACPTLVGRRRLGTVTQLHCELQRRRYNLPRGRRNVPVRD